MVGGEFKFLRLEQPGLPVQVFSVGTFTLPLDLYRVVGADGLQGIGLLFAGVNGPITSCRRILVNTLKIIAILEGGGGLVVGLLPLEYCPWLRLLGRGQQFLIEKSGSVLALPLKRCSLCVISLDKTGIVSELILILLRIHRRALNLRLVLLEVDLFAFGHRVHPILFILSHLNSSSVRGGSQGIKFVQPGGLIIGMAFVIKLIMEIEEFGNGSEEVDMASVENEIPRKGHRFAHKVSLFEQCRHILKKSYETRLPIENNTLLKLVDKSEFLKELAEIVGLDFVKGILRNAKLEIVDQRQVIVQEDQALNYMIVLLEGKLAIERSNFAVGVDPQDNESKEYLENLSLKTEGLVDKLTILAKSERDEMRKASKFQRKTSIPVSQYDFVPPILSIKDYTNALQNVERNILIHEQYGGKERLNGSAYKNRVFAVQRSILLVLQMNFLFYWLQMAYKLKMANTIQRLKTIPAFQVIEQEKIAEIITSMKLLRRKKNDTIYSEGDPAECIYILIDGQLKMTKDANLFKENPNDFYTDRRRLVRQIHNDTKPSKSRSFNKNNDDVLHFANLTTLYNYRPIKKSIEIGLISSFGLFGAEEVVFRTKRQATIHVNSIDASFYEIEYKKILEIIGVKVVDRFKEVLEASLSKKVLYRQSEFAEQVDFQNRANLTYFYTNEGQSHESPRKFRLEKINERVVPHTTRDTKDHAPAFYTTFNFNKMLSNRYTDSPSKEKDKRKKTNESMDTFTPPNYNKTEQKIVGISHSWNPIEKKVKQQKFISKMISPFKHQINISQPLIDQQFFKDVAKEQRRINKEFRSIRLSLGKKPKEK